MRNITGFFVLAILLVVASFGISIFNKTRTETLTVHVQDLQQQQIISGGKDNISTSIRYLIITDRETFICESNWLQGKFNNSDLYWHLKKDSSYVFRVSGLGKGLVTDYRNVLEATTVNKTH